jgi:hypothetical protein
MLLRKIRDEKLKQKASIPKKLEDGSEPIIDMHVNGFDCHALCNLGASISIMPRKIYDMLDLPLLEKCYYDVPIADVAKKKHLGRIDVTTQKFVTYFLLFKCQILDQDKTFSSHIACMHSI